jgi:hypothetical protein
VLTYRARSALAASLLITAAWGLAPVAADAQQRLTTPREHLGFDIGDDYRLATYDQFSSYLGTIARQSDRVSVVEIGRTAEDRPQLMAIVTAPENFARLERYREIARRLALAEGLTDAEARSLAAEGKAVVWIDGGLHANEVLGAHQLLETVWQLASRDDAETMRFLRDVIVLAVHANPDGMELVSSWYMRESDSTRRNINIPRLYQKYIGHDNNRDFYMSTQPETRNMNRVMYREWFPQIVYNHHQTGPAGTVMFAPPFRDPFNYNYDPLVPLGIDLVGAAMHNRFAIENKPGVTMRSGANYSTWWNGGLRTTTYFHNMIGLLTETIGTPTPMTIPFVAEQQLPRADMPFPIEPQRWHFRQSIDYSVTANKAVLDVASRHRESFLYNIYLMGKRSIERGSRDTWTHTPDMLEDAQKRVAEERSRRQAEQAQPAPGAPTGQAGAATVAGPVGSATAPFGTGANPQIFSATFRDPSRRDPRAYVISADQRDFPTATKFIHALQWTGITVHRATAPFEAGGRRYPAGSFVVHTAQAFRPHVMDMFEPQRHPNDFAYPGGPPRRPYDNAGWTLAYQMGVEFDRHLEPVSGPLERLTDFARPIPGRITGTAGAAGYLLARASNDAFTVVNRLLKAGESVHAAAAPVTSGGRSWPAGTFYITARPTALPIIERAASELGLSFAGTTAGRPADAAPVQQRRIALWDTYGGSMPSGWTRWLLEQYEFPFDVVYPGAIDGGSLRGNYDVLVLPTGAIGGPVRGGGAQQNRDNIPEQYHHMLGRLTEQGSTPALRDFLTEGGTIVTIGSSTALGGYLGLPIENHLLDRTAAGEPRPLPADRYYIPGSVLSVAVDTAAPVAAGMPARADVMFDNSPVFRLGANAGTSGVRRVAWFDSPSPLRSGWAWGQELLEGGVAIAEARVGRGTLYLFGPEILFRAQPHGTFRLFFNALTQ